MTRTEKIEQIITKMEELNNLWWKAEEDHDQDALDQHNILEQEIRAEMAEIGIDFDTVGAEYEDMINKLRRMTDQ
jgi:hypothetical protein